MSGQEWRLRAKCRSADPELPFAKSDRAQWFIRHFCDYCDVRAECLQFSIDHDGPGVYGGMTHKTRVEKGLVPPVAEYRPPCGTTGGYQSHIRRKEEPCRSCRAASRTYRSVRARVRRLA